MDQRGLGLVIYNLRQGVLKLGTTEKSIHLAVGKSCALSAQERQHTENRTATLSYMILHRVCGAFGMNCNGGRCFAFCVILLMRNAFCLSFQLPPRGPSNRPIKWGRAAGWSRIFISYQNGIPHFRDLGDQKIHVSRDLKLGRFLPH